MPSIAYRLGPRRHSTPRSRSRARERLNAVDRRANRVMTALCAFGAFVLLATMIGIAYEVINSASKSFSKFGLGFLVHTQWQPALNKFGGAAFIYGTLVTSTISLVLATTLGVAIGLFLSMLSPRPLAAFVGPLVEMLAAIPSVILGFTGLVVIVPFSRNHIEPFLHSALGFIPFFGTLPPTGNSIFTASLVLTIMVLPIIAALSRDLFLTVPQELTDGAAALGATRWEVIRGVVLPTTASGITAAAVLGFGRAIGEAIAVSFVIGGDSVIHASWFDVGDSAASRIATEFPGSSQGGPYDTAALFYLAAILLALGILSNLLSKRIAAGFRRHE